MNEIIIAVDFDGTLVEHDFPRIGREIPGAFEWLKKFQEAGAKLILWTMRNDQIFESYCQHAVDFCRDRGIEFWGVNCNPTQGNWTKSPKAYAHIYIDDAAIGCPLLYHREECNAVAYWRLTRECTCKQARPYVDWDRVGPIVMERLEQPIHSSHDIHIPEKKEREEKCQQNSQS